MSEQPTTDNDSQTLAAPWAEIVKALVDVYRVQTAQLETLQSMNQRLELLIAERIIGPFVGMDRPDAPDN